MTDKSHDPAPDAAAKPGSTSRRSFLKSSLALPVAVAAGGVAATVSRAAEPPATPAGAGALPRRKLGRNGPDVTMISLGGMMDAYSPEFLDMAWSMGIRYFDTADCYIGRRSEQIVGEWLKRHPERRKELFLVTKDHPRQGPKELLEMIDRRLERCGTDYIDLFFIHGISPKDYQGSLEWPKGGEFKEVCQELKRSGKAKMVGFSCHDGRLIDYLNAAAEGGFVDAIMLKYNVFFTPGDDFDRAVSACYDKGIGLVAMKEMRAAGSAPKRIPDFDKLGLNTHQAILHAVYSDPRMSAVCSAIANAQQMEENTAATRSFKKPLNLSERRALQETIAATRLTMCPGCPACAAHDSAAEFALLDISRYVTYYEQDGHLGARELYQKLSPLARQATEAHLAAARDACMFGVDYPAIARRAGRYFA